MTIKKAIPICMVVLVGLFMCMPTSEAYDRYRDAGGAGNCWSCHGDFTGSVSPTGSVFPGNDKHNMHRASSAMNAECSLCHTSGDGRNPFIGSSDGTGTNPGLGCVGCHGRAEDAGNDSVSDGYGAGLRQHHTNAGIGGCVNCHTDASPGNYTPVGEDVIPTYYGTADTAADEPCNPVAERGINENWTIGDFLGLDNDGDGDYDGADSDCAGGAVCGDGILDDGEACDDGNTANGDCCASDCTFESAGSTCGDPSSTDCDAADTCDGAGTCLENTDPDGTVCTDDGNDCTDDVCVAGACNHPASPSGTACGDGSDTDCDNPDTCDGAGACDANYEAAGTGCPDGLYCNGDETCDGVGACADGPAPCDPAVEFCNEDADVCEPLTECGNGVVEDGEECDGGECCATDCTYAAAGFACGDGSDTDCDNPDTCDGAGACNANYEAEGTGCPDGMYCNGEETCDGAGVCADGADPCDPAVETCNEDGDVCEPVDQCGNGILDDGEECDGGECCATDCTYAAAGFACGDGSDTDCDNPDTCDGAGACEANYEPAGTGCPDGMYCNGEETCDGAGVCADGADPCDPAVETCNEDGDVCEPVDQCGNGILDDGEECDGGECCATDCTYAAAGFACGDGSDTDCDNPDTCDGAGACEANYEPAGTGCPDGLYCNGEETCDGAGVCADGADPCDPAVETCNEDGDVCEPVDQCGNGILDDGEECDGGECCATDCTYAAAGFACGDGSDTDCDNPDTCDGAGFCESNLEGAGFACGDPTDTDCDNADTCDGAGFCESNLEGAGFACGDPTDTDCDNPDTCDGAGFCESNYEPFGTSCMDGSCDGMGECLAGEICFNEIDDDADGLIDCADPDCDQAMDGACDTGEIGICAAGTYVCFTPDAVCFPDNQPMPEGGQYGNCNDGLDNDCDGWTDLADPDCVSLVDLDIAKFRASKWGWVGGKVKVFLGVSNGGDFDEPRPASIVGVQNGVEVFRTPADFVVFDDLEEYGKTTFKFTYVPTAEGAITWTAIILDDVNPPDDQEDVATFTTDVIGFHPGKNTQSEEPDQPVETESITDVNQLR